MTLIIGIIAEKGVVLASDGMATLSTMNLPTARQPTREKLNIVNDKAIIGVSGPVGLGQLLTDSLNTLCQGTELDDKTPEQVMARVSQEFRKYIDQEILAAQKAAPIIGVQSASMSALSATIVALKVGGKCCLMQFNQQGSPELATPSLPFVAIGIGQQIADPFLAFIRRNLWRGIQLPGVGDAIFAAVWTLHQVIETNPQGVGPPMQVITIEDSTNGCTISNLTEDEIQEHLESAKHIEDYIAEYRFSEEEEAIAAIPKLAKSTNQAKKV